MSTVIKKPIWAATPAPTPQSASRQLARAALGARRVLRSASLSNSPSSTGAGPAPAIVSRALSSPGHTLPEGERTFMEQRFGHRFAAVRVHHDATAAASAQAISASAFSIGRNVFFAQDQFQPGSSAGRQLLAHELAHVMQHDRDASAATYAPSTSLRVSAADDPHEYEAEILADRALAPSPLRQPMTGQRPAFAGVIQRAKDDAKPAEPLDDPDVRAAIDKVWDASFGHPPFSSAINPEDLPEAGANEPTNEPETSQPPAPEPAAPPIMGPGTYREGKFEGVTFREAFFFILADGKPGPIQVSPEPLDIKGVVAPSGALGYVHTHPTQKRAIATETGGTLVMEGMLLTDEKAARDMGIPVYSVAENTVLKTYPDLRSEVFSRRALRRDK